MLMKSKWLLLATAVVATGSLAACAAKAPRVPEAAPQSLEAANPQVKWELEPTAVEILKTMSSRLAAARSMRFRAVVSYESPSKLGPALVYTTKSDVVLQRPNKLRVITSADGPPSEFYYDGKTITAFAPQENLAAVADAPPTIDGALKTAYDLGETYFPFTDVVVADPWGDLAGDIKLAFYVGQSHVVGGTTTDIVAYASDTVFAQIWIGADDKLPRMMRAVYRHDPSRLRHSMELSGWRLGVSVPAGTFTSSAAIKAKRIAFTRPDPKLPPDVTRPEKTK
jgi:hypothetical protein